MDGEAGPLDEGAERCFVLVQGLIALSELTRAIGLAAAPSSRTRSTSSSRGQADSRTGGSPIAGGGFAETPAPLTQQVRTHLQPRAPGNAGWAAPRGHATRAPAGRWPAAHTTTGVGHPSEGRVRLTMLPRVGPGGTPDGQPGDVT